MKKMELPYIQLTEEQLEFRKEVRQFLIDEQERGVFDVNCDSWLSGYSPSFSRKLGEKGWIGITWPKQYGGGEKSELERYVLIEELLAFGTPIAAHWFADRQTGPLILRYGTEEQKRFFLPKITKGKCFFSVGLSEPNSGSDLASLKSFAKKTEGGWILNGSKTWTSGAHYSDYMIVLCRTQPYDANNRHNGMSQLIVDLKSDGVTIRPIKHLTGENHFNEVFFEDVFIKADNLIGVEGNGWQQSMAELAYERSGPERILSTFPLFYELINILKSKNDKIGLKKSSQLVAEMYNLRLMSIGVAQKLEEKENVGIHAALVKDLGTEFEKKIVEVARLLLGVTPSLTSTILIERLLAQSIMHSPGFTLRGGTNEILRGIVAKGLI